MDEPGENEAVTITVRPWWDPRLAIEGHDVLGGYAEQYWLPVLGPAATLAHRSFVRALRDAPEGFDMDRADLARRLGLGRRSGAHGPTARAVDRLCYFGLARDGEVLEVRTHLPSLPPHLHRRLPRDASDRIGESAAG